MDASVQELLDLEWRLLEEAPQAGRQAEELFTIVRSSQLAVWSPELRASWRQDLFAAQAEGRNPINERYVYMLERTDPEQYAAMKNTLPAPSLEKLWLADWICQAQGIWQKALVKKYPCLTQNSWMPDGGMDGQGNGSTALWGELMACSVNTLRLYASQIESAQKAGKNLCEAVWEAIALQLGYESLEILGESVLQKVE